MKLTPDTGLCRHAGQGPPQQAVSRNPEISAGAQIPHGAFMDSVIPLLRGSSEMRVPRTSIWNGKVSDASNPGFFFRAPLGLNGRFCVFGL
jgi:hypothetical protein